MNNLLGIGNIASKTGKVSSQWSVVSCLEGGGEDFLNAVDPGVMAKYWVEEGRCWARKLGQVSMENPKSEIRKPKREDRCLANYALTGG